MVIPSMEVKKLAKKSPELLSHPGPVENAVRVDVRLAHRRPRQGAKVDPKRQVTVHWSAQQLRPALALANSFRRKQDHVYRLEG